jgi:hypothetical protein
LINLAASSGPRLIEQLFLTNINFIKFCAAITELFSLKSDKPEVVEKSGHQSAVSLTRNREAKMERSPNGDTRKRSGERSELVTEEGLSPPEASRRLDLQKSTIFNRLRSTRTEKIGEIGLVTAT